MEWMARRRPAGGSDPLKKEPRLPEPQHRIEDQQHPSTTACGRRKQPGYCLSSRSGQICLHLPTDICAAKNQENLIFAAMRRRIICCEVLSPGLLRVFTNS